MFQNSRPRLAAMTAALEAAERGDPVRLDDSGGDDLARLARHFNAALHAVADRERRNTARTGVDQDTGLPGRAALDVAVEEAEGRSVAVIGIDRFPELRTALGYHLSAAMTRMIGQRLASFWPEAPMGVLAGDRLGFILDTLRSEAACELIVAALEEPLLLGGVTVDVALTVGLARIDTTETMPAIERASIALDQARAADRKVATFDAKSYGDPATRLSLMSELQKAMPTGAVSLHYQPKYSLKDRRVAGAEALIRWRHPSKGSIPPDLFIPLAEETGHIRELTRWSLQQIIADQQSLREQGHDLRLALNLSGRLVSDRAFIDEAIWAVKSSEAHLAFEITETAAIGNPDAAFEGVKAMRAAGIAISIDDYGAGLSSLAYLKQIPADELKIDKAFVTCLSESARDALLVKSTVDLAHSLGLKVVAEGVETREAMALLSGMGCDLVQGWHIAKALPLEKLVEFLGEAAALDGWIAKTG